ncbi:US12 family protein [Candidatus Saccharibacteria bacterium]|nr:US12 family protein [Candidatus Saccharibacteria bacterium]
MGNRDFYYSQREGEMPLASYNSIIGAVLLWGFALSAIIIKLAGPYFATWNPIVLVIAYFAMAIAGIIISRKSDKPIVSFIGYNMVVVPFGAVLSVCLQGVSAVSVLHAAAATAGVTLIMLLLSIMFPKAFLSLGRVLFFSLLAVIVIEILCLVFGWYHPTIIDWIVVLIFCGYVGFDWALAQEKRHTLDNAIDSCVDLYIDIANIFLRLVALLGDDN